MKKLMMAAAVAFMSAVAGATTPADTTVLNYVNPFIGTTNFGTCNPGAIVPTGMMSVVPFNVMGSDENRYDKDARWWSTPYDYTNKYLTGFSHVNLSGVGCPELGSLLLMATSGPLDVDYHNYGSLYTGETASPGYYSTMLTRYGIKAEATATRRAGVTRFTFPAGESHILLNLGEGLTNESGAMLRKVSDTEYEGMKLLGTFCYNSQAVFPIYFVMQVNRTPQSAGYWKKQRPMTGAEAEWDPDHGRYKLYTAYTKEIMGDDIGLYLNYDCKEGETVEVKMGVSFVSVENARLNLNAEQSGKDFDAVHRQARADWAKALGRIRVEGGTEDQRTVFYTGMYHLQIHPNILQDVNGQYPAMESGEILTVPDGHDRYTVFSLWDTYRNVHQLLTLVYPERQLDMVRTMIDMYREHGWLPKWELYGRETLTMEGDPAIPVIADTWIKGLRGYDIETAYEAMRKGAFTPGAENLLRPDNDDYMSLGYVPLRSQFDNSVSHALEYYIADHALAAIADSLGHKEDARKLRERSLGYRNYYSKEYGTLRPLLPDGTFLSPFNPRQGENFEPNPGFHEGSAWNYTFYVPHDVKGLARLMGGNRKFVDKLQSVFDNGLYDPANEPDIAYPHLFSYFKGEEWRTQKEVRRLLDAYFKNAPDGIPGNEDTGTMSAWAIFNMMGFYPDCPGEPSYTLTAPVFDRVVIDLDAEVWGRDSIVIETERATPDATIIDRVDVGGKRYPSYRISHEDLIKAGTLKYKLK